MRLELADNYHRFVVLVTFLNIGKNFNGLQWFCIVSLVFSS